MSTVSNIFQFIDNQDYTVRKFEEAVGFPNGTLNAAKKAGAISTKNVQKIVEKFSTELIQAGYEIVDLGVLAEGEIAILNTSEKEILLKQITKSDQPDQGGETEKSGIKVFEEEDQKPLTSMMDLLLLEKERVIVEKERVIAEKDSHLQTMEENKREWIKTKDKLIEQNDKLLNLFEFGLNNLGAHLSEENRLQAAFQHFWIDQWAETKAKAEPGKSAAEFAKEARTAVAEKLGAGSNSGSPSVESTPGMQGSQTS